MAIRLKFEEIFLMFKPQNSTRFLQMHYVHTKFDAIHPKVLMVIPQNDNNGEKDELRPHSLVPCIKTKKKCGNSRMGVERNYKFACSHAPYTHFIYTS
jgi:hypothetical protein